MRFNSYHCEEGFVLIVSEYPFTLHMRIIFLVLSILLFSIHTAFAQLHEVGFLGGVANYKGELAEYINWKSPGPFVSIFYRANFSRVWSFRMNLGIGRISANDENSEDRFAQLRGHSFKSNLVEFSGQIEYNFLNFRGGDPRSPEYWTPYVFTGLGMNKIDQIQNTRPNYSTWSASIPLGIGIKAAVADRLNIGVEFGARFTYTDYLDDLGLDTNSGVPPGSLNPKYFTGNPNDKDMYFFTGLSLSWVVPQRGKNCPIKVPM